MVEKAETIPFDSERSEEDEASLRATDSLDAAFQRILEPLNQALRRVDRRLAARTQQEELSRSAASTDDRDDSATAAISDGLERLQETFERRFEAMERRLGELSVVQEPSGDQRTDDEWKRLILGQELCDDPALAAGREQLFAALWNGDEDARSFAAHVSLALAANQERLPPTLKDLGEAYYRWRPRTSSVEDPWERGLVAWVGRRCLSEGLRNSVELVVPGERFDPRRHQADDRGGGRVASVLGWVVLRDNGNVYARAKVGLE
ncbi:MAG TPA: hypothetical protein VGN57_23115 [Pirellulaceae bacterium]|nr:hypothetical protein [Pirellulaceae bacterium]